MMINEEDKKSFSIFDTSLKEEREAWEDVYYLTEYEDYDSCSDYEDFDYTQNETRKQRILDLDNIDFPTSFVSFDFENLFPQRVTACSVGMVKYKAHPTFRVIEL